MGKFRGLDKDEGWIKRRFAKIEKQMREDRAAKRLSASSIGAGGTTVKDGGSFVAEYPASVGGGEAVRFGPLGNGVFGLQMQDENGNPIFQMFRAYGTPEAPDGIAAFYGNAATYDLEAFFGAYVLINSAVSMGGPNGVKIEHSTTGSAANCFIDPADNRIWRSTSSLRYKRDVEDAEVDPAAVLNMQPRTWRDKAEVANDPDTETRYVGFIAEELHELGLGQFVVYDADGDPEAIAYDRLSVALLAVLKDLNARVSALEADDA